MKYLDFYNTNPKVVKAFFGLKMPELDTNDPESIKR
jgi:hypothetical protein